MAPDGGATELFQRKKISLMMPCHVVHERAEGQSASWKKERVQSDTGVS